METQEGIHKCAREGCENAVKGKKKYCSARCSHIATYQYLEQYNKRTRPQKEKKQKIFVTHSGLEVTENWFGEFMLHGDVEPNRVIKQKKKKDLYNGDMANCLSEETNTSSEDDFLE